MSDIRALVRAAFSAGFQCCRAYGDNHAHFDGEQKDRVMATYLDPLLAAFDPEPERPAVTPSASVEQAREKIMEAANKLTQIWNISKANGWQQISPAIDALIVAVRADTLDKVETVIGVMPLWGNGHYLDVEHFRGKLAHVRSAVVGSGTLSPERSERLNGQERSAIKETLDPSPLSFRAQVIQAGEDVTSAPGEYLPDAMMVAAARTALLIAKAQYEAEPSGYLSMHEIVDQLLTELSDGQTP